MTESGTETQVYRACQVNCVFIKYRPPEAWRYQLCYPLRTPFARMCRCRPASNRKTMPRVVRCLTTETVQGAALSLQGVDNVQRCDGLTLGVLGVGDGVTDDTLEEGLEDGAGLLVDHGRNTLDTTTTGETSDGGLGDTLDVVTKNLAVTLGTSLPEALAALATLGRVATDATRADMCVDGEGEYSRPVMLIGGGEKCGLLKVDCLGTATGITDKDAVLSGS
ncbi:hypothetical protein FJTKL_00339 [Diaporthe vaccinii]|uniref:Uncharacterized protein n=1 Tax=Diaporthe vaccinii TaxID=105482 RepID=A0ABR4E352_9PEZI